MFKSALGFFLPKFPLLIHCGLLRTAAFGFVELFGAAFSYLEAFVVFSGALGRYNCLGLLDCGSHPHPEKGGQGFGNVKVVGFEAASYCIPFLGLSGAYKSRQYAKDRDLQGGASPPFLPRGGRTAGRRRQLLFPPNRLFWGVLPFFFFFAHCKEHRVPSFVRTGLDK